MSASETDATTVVKASIAAQQSSHAKRLQELLKSKRPTDQKSLSEEEKLDQELAKIKPEGFYYEDLPIIIKIIRSVTWKDSYKIKLINRLLQKDPGALEANGAQFVCKNSEPLISISIYTLCRKQERESHPNFIYFKTGPLHEAIFRGQPKLVEMLCQLGANVNVNLCPELPAAKNGTYSREELEPLKEYSYCPLDLALQPASPDSSRNVLFLPEIIQILIKYGATRADGSIPKPISREELQALMKEVREYLNTAHHQAEVAGKKLIILLPEYHCSRHCMLLELIILRAAAEFGLKRFYMEIDEQVLTRKRTENSWIDEVSGCEFLTWDYPFLVSEALGMIVTPVDLWSRKNGDPLSARGMHERNVVMRDKITKIGESGVWLVGEAHLEELMTRVALDPSKYSVVAINTCPESLGSKGDFAFNDRVIQLYFKPQGLAEMMTGEDMLRVLKSVDPTFCQAMDQYDQAAKIQADQVIASTLAKDWGLQDSASHVISEYVHFTPFRDARLVTADQTKLQPSKFNNQALRSSPPR